MSDFRCMAAQTLKTAEDAVARLAGRWGRLVVEPKIDGARLLVVGGEMQSRSGKPFAHLGRILGELEGMMGRARLRNIVLDGELWAGSWNKTVSIIRAMKSERDVRGLRYLVFDVIPLQHWRDRCRVSEALMDRRVKLEDLIGYGRNVAVVTQNPYSIAPPKDWADLQRQLRMAEKDGYEGLMVKDLMGPYEFKRSWGWMKVIRRPLETVVVEKVLEGKGKHVGRTGKLLCVTKQGVLIRCDGMTDVARERWWKHPEQIVGRQVEVSHKGRNETGKLRQPKFVRVRDAEVEGEGDGEGDGA